MDTNKAPEGSGEFLGSGAQPKIKDEQIPVSTPPRLNDSDRRERPSTPSFSAPGSIPSGHEEFLAGGRQAKSFDPPRPVYTPAQLELMKQRELYMRVGQGTAKKGPLFKGREKEFASRKQIDELRALQAEIDGLEKQSAKYTYADLGKGLREAREAFMQNPSDENLRKFEEMAPHEKTRQLERERISAIRRPIMTALVDRYEKARILCTPIYKKAGEIAMEILEKETTFERERCERLGAEFSPSSALAQIYWTAMQLSGFAITGSPRLILKDLIQL